MNEQPHYWLKSFTLSAFATDCLQHTSAVFEFAKNGLGGEYFRQKAQEYAKKHHFQVPPAKSLNIDYTNRYEGFEALFVQAWPCLHLSLAPVYLAAVRIGQHPVCRIFRMNTLEPGQLYLNELTIDEHNSNQINVPTYQDASALIFSYTLGTPCFPRRMAEEHWERQKTAIGQLSFSQQIH